jgi:hypothetical protein
VFASVCRLAKIAILLGSYLGNALPERHIITELLDCSSDAEMIETLNVWQIPTPQNVDLSLGTLVANTMDSGINSLSSVFLYLPLYAWGWCCSIRHRILEAGSCAGSR